MRVTQEFHSIPFINRWSQFNVKTDFVAKQMFTFTAAKRGAEHFGKGQKYTMYNGFNWIFAVKTIFVRHLAEVQTNSSPPRITVIMNVALISASLLISFHYNYCERNDLISSSQNQISSAILIGDVCTQPGESAAAGDQRHFSFLFTVPFPFFDSLVSNGIRDLAFDATVSSIAIQMPKCDQQ